MVFEFFVGEANGVPAGKAEKTVTATVAAEGPGVLEVVPAAVELDHQPLGPPDTIDVDLPPRDGDVHVQLRARDASSVNKREKQLLQLAAGERTAELPAHQRFEPPGAMVPACARQYIVERPEVEELHDPPLLVGLLERPWGQDRGDVQHRPRRAGAWDLLDNRPVAREEDRRVVIYPVELSSALDRHRHIDLAARASKQPGQHRRIAVAEHRV
jgi:hypothetical protein